MRMLLEIRASGAFILSNVKPLKGFRLEDDSIRCILKNILCIDIILYIEWTGGRGTGVNAK